MPSRGHVAHAELNFGPALLMIADEHPDYGIQSPLAFGGTGTTEECMDDDLAAMPREQLIDEVRKLRRGIRSHRDSTGHDLCWHHPELWELLPERADPLPVVPDWPEFLRGCVRYRQSLDEQAPEAPRSS